MKRILIVCGVVAAMLGCTSTNVAVDDQAGNIEHQTVVVGEGASLKKAVVTAATRRRWTATETSANVIRCLLVQREHKVEIDIVLENDKTYSIRCVSSNIPARKYQQWINNLQREIALHASR